jgi:hypothetical protein
MQLAVEACGGIDPRAGETAWRRILSAGVVTTSVSIRG